MTRVTCRLTAKNRDQLRNHTLGNRARASFPFLMLDLSAVRSILPASMRPMATGTVAACYHFCWRCCSCRYGVFSQIGLPPFHFSNPGRGSEAEPSADGCPGKNFWNSICDLVHFDAVWWQLFVGCRTRYICNCAIKIEPIYQSQCHRDCTAVLSLLSNEHALKSGTFGAGPAGTRNHTAQIRDIPGNPGRVATLLAERGARACTAWSV